MDENNSYTFARYAITVSLYDFTPVISDLCTAQQIKLAIKTLNPWLLRQERINSLGISSAVDHFGAIILKAKAVHSISIRLCRFVYAIGTPSKT